LCTYTLLVEKSVGKRLLSRPRRKWEMMLKRIFLKQVLECDLIPLAKSTDWWRAVVNTIMDSGFHVGELFE
jgi:hypothetical protein